MGVDVVGNIAPTITTSCRYWYSSNEDGLNADQARKLGAALQRSIDDCRIDEYGRQLFPRLLNDKQFRCLVEFHNGAEIFELRKPDERRFVDRFVSEVQRFIEFLQSCEGFRIQ